MTEEISQPLIWDDLLNINHPLIVGILNVTPDSFSDGGLYLTDIHSSIELLFDQGAHIIDVGAESTRSGAKEVDPIIQIQRLKPVVEYIGRTDVKKYFSIDTRHSKVASFALENGFSIVNDVSAGRFDSEMANVIASKDALCVLMHSRGTPENMNQLTNYADVCSEVVDELSISVELMVSAGVNRKSIMVDPGIGFAKTPQQGLELLERLSDFKASMDLPVMVGISRKTIVSFIMSGDPYRVPFNQRDEISAQMCRELVYSGVDALRVHSVELTIQNLSDSG